MSKGIIYLNVEVNYSLLNFLTVEYTYLTMIENSNVVNEIIFRRPLFDFSIKLFCN